MYLKSNNGPTGLIRQRQTVQTIPPISSKIPQNAGQIQIKRRMKDVRKQINGNVSYVHGFHTFARLSGNEVFDSV